MGRYSTELRQLEIKLAKLQAHKDYLEKLQALEEKDFDQTGEVEEESGQSERRR